MSIDWNWGIFLQQAPFGNTTYLGWLWSGFQVTVAVDNGLDYRVSCRLAVRYSAHRPNRFLSGIGTCYVELFRNVPLIVQFFTWYLVVPELLPENIGMWFKSELDPNIQFFVSSMMCLGCLPLRASASRCVPPFSRCRAGRKTRVWRWG
jgi:glutamate/aspartate transport system permease protein